MQILHNSLLKNGFALLRFFLILIFKSKSIKSQSMFYIGKRNKIFTKNDGRIKIGKKFRIVNDCELQSRGSLIIGNNVNLNSFSRIIAFYKIEIGNNVTIAEFVTILDHDHSYEFKDGELTFSGYKTEQISIGNNVWIGDKTTILKGVSIGNNVIIGANTLINKDVPDNCIVAGNPFKIIKKFENKT